MELRRYAELLWRWLWLIVLGTVLAAGAAYLTSKHQVPVYQASTKLLVNQSKAVIMDSSVLPNADRLAATYAEMLRDRPVLEETAAHLGVSIDDSAVTVSPIRSTQLLVLSVEDTNPQRAAAIANEIPKVFIAQNDAMQTSRFAASKASLQRQLESTQADIQRLEDSIAALRAAPEPDQNEIDSQSRDLQTLQLSYNNLSTSYEELRIEEAKQLDTLLVTSDAQPPMAPIRPKTMQNTLLAAVVGAMLALGVAYLVEYLDDVLKNPDEVKKTLGLTTLGAIPAVGNKELGEELISLGSSRSAATESYRVLRTNLQFASVDRPLHTLLVTSPSPTEGKSMTVANLGVSLAQAGRRVILVDTDLHRPRLHHLFKLANAAGVTSALLEDGPDLDSLLQHTGVPGLRVMTSGPLPPNAAELLGRARMHSLLAALAEEADILVLDSPPAMALSDASVLSTQVDGVLLVLDAVHTRREAARRALAGLLQLKAHVIGAVLNKVPTRGSGYYYYYYYYHYGHYYGSDNGDGNGSRNGDGNGNGGHTNGSDSTHRKRRTGLPLPWSKDPSS